MTEARAAVFVGRAARAVAALRAAGTAVDRDLAVVLDLVRAVGNAGMARAALVALAVVGVGAALTGTARSARAAAVDVDFIGILDQVAAQRRTARAVP